MTTSSSLRFPVSIEWQEGRLTRGTAPGKPPVEIATPPEPAPLGFVARPAVLEPRGGRRLRAGGSRDAAEACAAALRVPSTWTSRGARPCISRRAPRRHGRLRPWMRRRASRPEDPGAPPPRRGSLPSRARRSPACG